MLKNIKNIWGVNIGTSEPNNDENRVEISHINTKLPKNSPVVENIVCSIPILSGSLIYFNTILSFWVLIRHINNEQTINNIANYIFSSYPVKNDITNKKIDVRTPLPTIQVFFLPYWGIVYVYCIGAKLIIILLKINLRENGKVAAENRLIILYGGS